MILDRFASTTRKGQSAIEYLTTYGWALLAIVIVGAVLMQMGIFSGQCPTADTFTADDVGFGTWAVNTNGDIVMSIENRQQSSITVQSINFTASDGTTAFEATTVGVSVSGGQTSDSITVTNQNPINGCETLDVTIQYTLEDLGEDVEITGQATREF